MNQDLDNLIENKVDYKQLFFRYFTFWKWFLLSFVFFNSLAFIYLRYADYLYKSSAKIEIIDKSQDSEMALPTAMTIFNRSMINLDNEIGVLSSYSLHSRVVKKLNSNIHFISVGRLKSPQNHPQQWLDDYNFNLKIEADNIKVKQTYELNLDGSKLLINLLNEDDEVLESTIFQKRTTKNIKHKLPFDITIGLNSEFSSQKKIVLLPFEETVLQFQEIVNISKVGNDSDQLNLSISYPNKMIGEEYLNTFISEFDNDGIVDRQLEYKRTIDFVDSRSKFISKELDLIENEKKDFKEKNKLTDIKSDASINVTQQFAYDSELFKARSQKNLVELLNQTISKKNFELLPVDIGIENVEINLAISEYNLLIKERNRFLISAGLNNSLIKNLDSEISTSLSNILKSVENYENSLSLMIKNLVKKEMEFEKVYQNIPENEKILRSIERELEVKEALFLLLLQKREEASINFAVVKPSIKIIDSSRSLPYPVSPRKIFVYLGFSLLGILLPFSFFYLRFTLDTTIHTREQLQKLTGKIPIIGEVPHEHDKNKLKLIVSPDSRKQMAESIRMIIANLNFILFNDDYKKRNNLILVTSSIKGEGKTIVSTNIASILSSKFEKVLLVGSDLRNPQIHKLLGVEKSIKGLADYIYKDNLKWQNLILKHKNLDVILSGTIPPNPTDLLASNKFKNFIDEVKKSYDYVIIDSAPCLLVSDTFEISKYVDTTLYVVRSNFSDERLVSFINECSQSEKIKGMNIVLNGIGNSRYYGYSYGYSYGYKYGYKYGYNYGYGYGYSAENN